jgi:hypothetical protein
MASNQERLKVHRRTVLLDRVRYTILSPRPSSTERFATNRFHEAWHVVTDVAGAHLLARLCWAMAYQRHDRTLLVIDPEMMVPNPFDADPSSPLVIVNHELGPFGREVAADLRSKLPFRAPSEGTVVLQTRGLDLALEDPQAFAERDDQASWRDKHQRRRWIEGGDGLVIIAAPPPVLRAWGVELSGLGRWSDERSSRSYLDYPKNEGEVQVLDDFAGQIANAVSLRGDLFPGQDQRRLTDDEKQQICSFADTRDG